MIKSFLIHLSMNMWEDWAPEPLKHLDPELFRKNHPHHFDRQPLYNRGRLWSDTLKTDDAVWKRVTEHFAACGGNMLIVDVGDGVRYQSHPEIAVEGAWSTAKLKDELARCRDLGLEVIPKLNFSSCHDAWLHEYARMLSTKPYYQVCHDLVSEVAELFGGPRFFHIGMDEEKAAFQLSEGFLFRVERAPQLWWHDLAFYCEEIRRVGGRAWMWSDKLWDCSDEEFQANVPLDVVQSNWYYSDEFPDKEGKQCNTYLRLARLGYDQIPAGSNWWSDANYAGTVNYCTSELPQEKLLGFMTAPWYATIPEAEKILLEACDQVAAAHGGKA